MSDLFHVNVPILELDDIYHTMEKADWHIFQVLTKRARWMRDYLTQRNFTGFAFPRHIWHGISVEDQKTADERIPVLLQTPSEIRFLSIEPILEPIHLKPEWLKGIHWAIIGGESGGGARANETYWYRLLLDQLREANVPPFVKQLGSRHVTSAWHIACCCPPGECDDPDWQATGWPTGSRIHVGDTMDAPRWVQFKNRKGGNPEEWPRDLRVREFPR